MRFTPPPLKKSSPGARFILLLTGEQYDPNAGFYYLRARWMDPETGRFLSEDSFKGNIFEPVSLQKYLYAANNPILYVDPNGQFLISTMCSIGLRNILIGAAALSVYSVVASAQINLYESGAINSITTPSLVYHITKTISGVRAWERRIAKAKSKVERMRQESKCEGNLLFHYTNIASAGLIVSQQKMFRTGAYASKGLPAGAYATEIPPWARMTQKDLAIIFYFSPARRAKADLSWFVALCNDIKPPFLLLGASQWVKSDGKIFTDVHAIGAAPNAMP